MKLGLPAVMATETFPFSYLINGRNISLDLPPSLL